MLAVLTNVESQQYRRRQTAQCNDEVPEHPRSSSTDDVECFFPILHNQLGLYYDIKAIQQRWRVLCNEFGKGIDPDLPFYYYTSDKHRYRITDLPSFDTPPSDGRSRLDFLRPPRREDIGQVVLGRAAMPVRGTRTIRQQYRSNPATLPQPSTHHGLHLSTH